MATEAGRNPHGAPARFGTATGRFDADEGAPKVLVPVRKLAEVRGQSGEQKNVRQHDLESLIEYMRVHGRLPPSAHRAEEYAPYVEVDQTGTPWMNEGNHRVMAADRLGWSYLPTEVRYYNGGELERGLLNPADVLSDHSALYGTKRYARGGLAAYSRGAR
jgi:hypothetical protein